jgi:hypothetical protein
MRAADVGASVSMAGIRGHLGLPGTGLGTGVSLMAAVEVPGDNAIQDDADEGSSAMPLLDINAEARSPRPRWRAVPESSLSASLST